MPLTGDIQTFSLSAVGRLLNQEKKTGILKVSSREHETRIYFRGGDIVFVSGALAAEHSLGSLLKERQLVTEREIEKSLNIARRESKRLGLVLMENGLVSQDKIVQALNYQFKEAISTVLTWREGDFVYEDGLKGFVEDIRLKLDPIRLVAEAERWKAYRALIPNDSAVFRIKAGALQTEAFSTDGSMRVMLLIDGKRDVSQVMVESGLPRMGVYRAISALHEQGAIERLGAAPTFPAGRSPDPARIVLYYLHTLHEAARLIALELGEKKAHSMVAGSLLQSFEDKHLAEAAAPGGDPEENARRFFECQKERGKPLDGRQLDLCFKKAVYLLLQAEYQVLGFKAARGTIGRLVDLSEKLKGYAPEVAGSMLTFLRTLFHDKGYFTGEKRLSGTGGLLRADRERDHQDSPDAGIARIGGAAIIAFYSRIIHAVMREMEAEIGSKAGALLSDIIESSDYYDKFMSQYRVSEDVETNVDRIREHISREGYRLGKRSFITGFQQTLNELLLAKKALLGKKSADATVRNIETLLSTTEPEAFRPLAMNVMITIKSLF